MTMVIVTHEMPFARAVSDRAVFLDGGVVSWSRAALSRFENLAAGADERVLEIVPRDEQRSGVVIHEQVDDRTVACAEFIAVGFDHLSLSDWDGGREVSLVLRPVGAVVAQIEHDLVGKRIANLLGCQSTCGTARYRGECSRASSPHSCGLRPSQRAARPRGCLGCSDVMPR